MYQELLNKLHVALYAYIPLAEDREQLIGEIGETIWLESLDTILDALPKDIQDEAVTLLNSGEIDKAVELFEESNIDIDKVIETVSGNVMDDLLKGMEEKAEVTSR
jgi:hypothetical protein